MKSFALASMLAFIPLCAAAENVVTYHNSLQRHGAYRVPGLTLAAAANIHPDKAFHPAISGHVYAQPLFWHPAGGKSVVIVATESNSVYAVDAKSGATIWQKQLGASVRLSKLPCGNIDPDGITGTPVIDPVAGLLYLDALTSTKNGPRHLVHALSLSDGSEVPQWPLDIQAGLAAGGVTFSSSTQGERSALQLFKGALYVNYGGNWGDCGTYHGTVVEVNTSSPAVAASWQTRANGGGIWAQGGLAGDGQDLFATTGNTMGASQWSDGEAIVRLTANLTHSTARRDYFTPANWNALDNSDEDLGGTEALPLDIAGNPIAHRVLAFGKDGNAYLTDRTNLGGVGGQLALYSASGGEIITAPAVYQTRSATMVAFTNLGGCGGSITMLSIAASGSSPISKAWCTAFSGAGAPIITTTDGAADAIVWVAGAEGDGQLHGFNALNGQAVFSGAGTSMAGLHHFVTPIVAENRFYVAADNALYAFAWK